MSCASNALKKQRRKDARSGAAARPAIMGGYANSFPLPESFRRHQFSRPGRLRRAGRAAVRWRRLFRSDHLAALTPQDVALLSNLGLARVCDFRGEAERAPLACALPGVVVHSLAIEPTVVQRMKELLESGHALTAQDTVRLMQQTYRAFVHDNAPRFAELFEQLLDNDAPLVFHCTAGKDRTGYAAA